MTKRTNNFAGYQAGLVETHLRRIEAELKDIAGRSRLEFKDFDRLVNYVSKVTSLHRTTLKRNAAYRKALRDFHTQQPGAASLVAVDDASPELLRAMVEEQRLTIANLTAQIRALKARFAQLDTKDSEATSLPAPSNSHSRDDVAFHDTALALWQLIRHLNQTAGVESIVVDEEAGVIIDTAIPNPRKRREMAIGPERTKSFMAWYAANKELLKI
ncbi:hypothetical protein [Burkholderia ubonensis]|uniref:hypothetical protein n=1 Tax=Burkholderia ubonensis TaxID=101571 RepID=UPI000A7E7E8C|nr:hypothetical protein [Burkholderia ubonensis]